MTDVAIVASRTAMKALDGTTHSGAFLTEVGREGAFVWNAASQAPTLKGVDKVSSAPTPAPIRLPGTITASAPHMP